jgi:hypothetical protein
MARSSHGGADAPAVRLARVPPRGSGNARSVSVYRHNGATRHHEPPALTLADVRARVRAHEDPVALVAAFAWAGALAHAFAVPAHADHWLLASAFFAVVAVAQFGWGIAVYRNPSRPILVAGLAGSLAVVALWVVTRTTGLPFGPDAGTPEPIETLDAMATTSELLTAGMAWMLLQPRLAARIPGTAVYVALILTLTAMVMSGGHSHGS